MTAPGNADGMCISAGRGLPPSPDDPGAVPSAGRSGPVISLVLRIWYEPGTPPRFRARGVQIPPGPDGTQVFTASTVADTCQAIRDWLESIPASLDG